MISKSLIEGGAGRAAGAMLGSLGDNGGAILIRRSLKLVSVELDSVADSVGEAVGLKCSLSMRLNLAPRAFLLGDEALSGARLAARVRLIAREPRLEGE